MQGNINYKNGLWLASISFIACVIYAALFNSLIVLVVPFFIIALLAIIERSIHQTENLFWLLIFCLPLSTEINITPALGFDFPDEILMMLITALVIAKFVLKLKSIPFHLVKNSLFFISLLLLFWSVISSIFSVTPVLSLKYVAAKIWFIVPFVIFPSLVLTGLNSLKKLGLALLIPMFFVVVQCLVRHSLLNFSFEGIKQTLSPFFRNHVNYSSMLVCLLAILWCFKMLTPTTNKKGTWFINIGFVIGLTALYFAYSRGAWLAFFSGFVTVFFVKRKLIQQVFISAISVLFIAVVFLWYNNNYVKFIPDYESTIFHDDLAEHLKSTTTLKDLSNAERFYRWVAGTKMIIAKPITGFGANTFYDNYKNYAADAFKTYVSNNPEHSSVHNYYLLTALEQGIPALLLFLLLLFWLLKSSEQLYHQLQSVFYKTIALTIAVVIVMIAIINFMSDMIETDKIGSLFWLCVGLIIFLEKKLQEEKETIA